MKEEEDLRTNRDRFVKEIRRAQREEKFQLSRKRMEELPRETAGDSNRKLIIMDDRFADSIRKYLSNHAASSSPTTNPTTCSTTSKTSATRICQCAMKQSSQSALLWLGRRLSL